MSDRIVRCADWARAEHIDPIGTAGSYAGYCCVEWPLPWPSDIRNIPELSRLAEELDQRGVRLQLLHSTAARPGLHIIVHRLPAARIFEGYLRAEAFCLQQDLVSTALQLLDPACPVRHDHTDVLLCTHGRRDVCCGSQGTALAKQLEFTGGLRPGARLWRTSHTGGHRFAPTAIVLPEGTLWAFVTGALLQRVVSRDGPVRDVLPYYRGCTGLGTPALQTLERLVLADVGWNLFDSRRIGSELGDGRVRIDVLHADETTSFWEAQVEVLRTVPLPGCGATPLEIIEQQEWCLSMIRKG